MERMILIDTDKILKEYKQDLQTMNLTDETVRNYYSMVRIFIEFMKENGYDILNADRYAFIQFLQHLKNERRISFKRIKYYFTALASFYDFLVYAGYINLNPILAIRKRYLKSYKRNDSPAKRKMISVDEMASFINSIMDPRDKAIAILLAKTGIRKGELIRIDVDDINWEEMSITLKPTPKRSNRIVFFDAECAKILRRWLKIREKLNVKTKALFVNQYGERLQRNGVYEAVVKWAKKFGIYDENSDKLEDHFNPHCFRHWFTTMLLRNGMPREYVQELRGDSRNEAIDIYHHIDREELRKAYLAAIPKLGVI